MCVCVAMNYEHIRADNFSSLIYDYMITELMKYISRHKAHYCVFCSAVIYQNCITCSSVSNNLLLYPSLLRYFERNPQYWHPNHNVAVIGIENGNTLKMALYFDYILKPQNFGVDQKEFGEKTKRRSELVIELMKIMEELNITCSVVCTAPSKFI